MIENRFAGALACFIALWGKKPLSIITFEKELYLILADLSDEEDMNK